MNRMLLPIALLLLTSCATRSTATTPGPAPMNHVPTASLAAATATHPAAPAATWDLNATIIEACSCPMFCQCYFYSRPAGIGCCAKPDDPLLAQRYCRFNNAMRVNRGSYNGTKLDGMKFWIAGDLGSDFSQGQMNWAIMHYEPSATKEQREGIQAILGALYPVKWSNFTIGRDAAMEWNGGKDKSVAKLDGGKLAEVVLKRNQGMTDEPIVIRNLKYWGAPRNEGFVLMANEVEAYRDGTKSYEFKGTNGFMITVDINSNDVAGGKKGY
jgi:hypothetical protein